MKRLRIRVLAVLALLACTPPPGNSRPDADGGIDAVEAPMLHREVVRGNLPPLAARLPEDPLVVTPAERPGEYGGTWRMIVEAPALANFKVIGGYAPLIRWKADASGVTAGLASSWETSDDGTTLTMHLRHGVKWSDGVEFTSEDLSYWAGLLKDESQRLQAPFWTLVDSKPMTTSAPDRYTFVMRFAGPNYYASLHVATGITWSEEYLTPKHYLEAFDPRVHPQFHDFSIFDRKNRVEQNPDRPTLNPWRLVRIDDAGNRAHLERNPYYWMVDTKGRQLPYIDRIVTTVVDDPQLRTLKILAGDIDAQFRLVDLDELGLLTEGRAHGRYRILRWRDGTGARNAIVLNWSAPDPATRALIRDLRFRRALSLGIDRAKINEVAFRGLGLPQQATISRESWHFQSAAGKKALDDWALAGAQFDLPQANALLDEMGLGKRDAEGYRLRPDGGRVSLLFDLPPIHMSSVQEDESRIVCEGWRALGIDASTHNFPLATWSMRISSGEFTVSSSVEAEMDLFTYPDWVFPTTEEVWHGKVGRWYRTGGKEGEPPTGPMKRLLDLYARIQREPDRDRANDLVLDAIRLHTQEGYFALGTVADLPSLVILRDNFHNVPEEPRVLAPWGVAAPATSFPETFFFSKN